MSTPDFRNATAPLAVPPAEGARLLSISLSKLYELLRTGELQSYEDGCARRITMASINAYIARRLAESAGGWRQITPPPRCRQKARTDQSAAAD